MAGKIIGNAISLLILVYIVLLIIFYFMHLSVGAEISDITYNTAEAVSLTGELPSELYKYLEAATGRYGSFRIELKYEKHIDGNNYDVFFENENIIDVPMNIGDRLTIYISSLRKDLFETLLGAALLNVGSGAENMPSLMTVKCVVITKDGD